jgi:hypothetical protein
MRLKSLLSVSCVQPVADRRWLMFSRGAAEGVGFLYKVQTGAPTPGTLVAMPRRYTRCPTSRDRRDVQQANASNLMIKQVSPDIVSRFLQYAFA